MKKIQTHTHFLLQLVNLNRNKQEPQSWPATFISSKPISEPHLCAHGNQPITAWKDASEFPVVSSDCGTQRLDSIFAEIQR